MAVDNMKENLLRPPLSRDEVRKAIERRRPSRVPMMIHQWTYPKMFGEREAEVRGVLARYPNDMYTILAGMPDKWDNRKDKSEPKYSWLNIPPPPKGGSVAHDADVGIKDWAQLDGILAAWPDPNSPRLFDGALARKQAECAGRYSVAHWGYCLYERFWDLRGMENALCDFYENPNQVHRLLDAITSFYVTLIERAGRELNTDGIYVTDDIGMQTGPMFMLETFREFLKPRYARLIKAAHDNGMHFWMHTCGDVRLFLDDLVEIGLDVIHPIQKYTMPEKEIARKYGDRLCVWAGMDVQYTLPRGTPEEVRREVQFMIDTYDRPDGGCMVTVGNGVTPDVPLANLEAFLAETYEYGLAHRRGGGVG